MNQLSGAPVVMHKKGQSTDAAVLKEIMMKPGIAIAEIAENLEWTNGKADGSVNRLIVEGRASVKHNLKKGMLVKTVYPADFDKKQDNIVQIPTELVNCDLWREKAFVYALSRSTIGIAPHEVGEWGVKAFSVEYVSIEKRPEAVTLKLPERLAGFYQLENSEISLSAVGDLVFATVETVLPVKLPTQSAEKAKYALTPH
jgi:hypothetical protein